MSSNLFGQFQHVNWQTALGGTSSDLDRTLCQATDGNYFIGSATASGISGNKTQASYGSFDYWVIKLDTNGNILWQKTVGGSSSDELKMLKATPDGGCIAAGYSSSGISGIKTEMNYGLADYWVVKFNSSGVIEWQNTIGGNKDDFLNCIELSTDGGYLLGGYSQSGVSGEKTEGVLGAFVVGEYDYWIVKLNSTGNLVWQNTIGGFSDDRLYCIGKTSDDGYILAGTSDSQISGDKTDAPIIWDIQDYWIVKINNIGDVIWDVVIGGSDKEELSLIKVEDDDGILIVGNSDSPASADKSEGNFGEYDYWIVKTNAIGEIEWENTIGGDEFDFATTLQINDNGEYLIGGDSESEITGDKSSPSYNNSIDFWIVKLDSAGMLIDQTLIGGFLDERLAGMLLINDTTLLLTGTSYSGFGANKTLPSFGGFSDCWVLEVNTQPLDIFSITNDTSICFSDSITLAVQTLPDVGSSYYTIENIPYSPIPIDGKYIALSDDNHSAKINMEFEFCFFEETYSSFYIGSNGWISFGGTGALIDVYSSESIPNATISVPKNSIFCPWADWNPFLCDSCISYQTIGISPNRKLVIEFNEVPMYNCPSLKGTFQIILNENLNTIENHIGNKDYCAWEGGTATQGIQNLAGTVAYAVPDRNGSVWTTMETSVRYTPSGVKWYQDGELLGVGNEITLTPESTSYYTAIFTACDGISDTAEVAIEVLEGTGLEICDGADNDCNGLVDDLTASVVITSIDPIIFCAGETCTLVATHTGGTLQWYKGAAPIVGATNDSIIVTAKGKYKCVLTSDCGDNTSNIIITNVNKLPPGTINAIGPTTFCEGDSVGLKVSALAGLSYQWYKGAVPISGATSFKYFAKTTGNYRCMLTFTATGCAKFSSNVLVNVVCKETDLILTEGAKIYPNPTSGTLTLFIPNNLDSHVKLVFNDETGRKVYEWEGELNDEYASLNVGDLPSGTYTLTIFNSNSVIKTKLVIVK